LFSPRDLFTPVSGGGLRSVPFFDLSPCIFSGSSSSNTATVGRLHPPEIVTATPAHRQPDSFLLKVVVVDKFALVFFRMAVLFATVSSRLFLLLITPHASVCASGADMGGLHAEFVVSFLAPLLVADGDRSVSLVDRTV